MEQIKKAGCFPAKSYRLITTNILIHVKNLIIINSIIFYFSVFIQCSSHLTSRDPDVIEVKHHTIYLQPIKGLQQLELNELWPKNKIKGSFLTENILQIWKHLLSEFRRCEKYGLYTMVDSTVSSTVHITPQIITMRVRNDTLHIPIKIETFNTAEKISASLTIHAFGLCPSDTSDTVTFQKLSVALADYRRTFPYQETVSHFYSQGNKQ